MLENKRCMFLYIGAINRHLFVDLDGIMFGDMVKPYSKLSSSIREYPELVDLFEKDDLYRTGATHTLSTGIAVLILWKSSDTPSYSEITKTSLKDI